LKRKLIAAIACRNSGSRLFGKPLQNLDIKKPLTILEYQLKNLKQLKFIKEIVLGISYGNENQIFIDLAKKYKIKYILGDQKDVLSRLIKCGNLVGATDIFRVTSESPFTYLKDASKLWKKHILCNYDATFLDNIIDGCGYEIINLSSLKFSHKFGISKHRSELCTLYIRENLEKFKVNKVYPRSIFCRKDLRLTVDYPEDLVVCREVYKFILKNKMKSLSLEKIINFLDKRKDLKKLINPFVISGYKKMYK